MRQWIDKVLKAHETDDPEQNVRSLAGKFILQNELSEVIVMQVHNVRIEMDGSDKMAVLLVDRVSFNTDSDNKTEVHAEYTDVTCPFKWALSVSEGKSKSSKLITESEFKRIAGIAMSLKAELFKAVADITA